MLFGNSITKIFITGGAGFIGSHAVDILLSQGYEVAVYDNLSNGKREFIEHHFGEPNFKFIEGSILDVDKLTETIKGYDLVCHFAANTDIIGGHEQPRRDLMDCVVGTFNVVEAMRIAGIQPIIFSSTGAVYGELCKDVSMSESAGPLLPVSNYAAGKIGSEAFISAYCHLYGLRGWMFRFGNVIGGRMTHGVIVDFIKRLRDDPKKLLIYGDGHQEKNYFLVEECIEGMAFAFRNIPMDDEKPCDIFNLGADTISKVIDIAEIIKEEMGYSDAILEIEGKKQAWPGDQPKVHISVDKINKFGWSTELDSDKAVRVAVKRMLGKNG
jgi:UDP-glucose 4-epimerase